jgi:hypothetical protein
VVFEPKKDQRLLQFKAGGCLAWMACAPPLNAQSPRGQDNMSDHWIILIPEDPQFLPEAEKQSRARDRFAEMAPHADQIEITVCDEVEFFDCGANFERILCPDCRREISFEWWENRWDEDSRNGFNLAKYATPCCRSLRTLHGGLMKGPRGTLSDTTPLALGWTLDN